MGVEQQVEQEFCPLYFYNYNSGFALIELTHLDFNYGTFISCKVVLHKVVENRFKNRLSKLREAIVCYRHSCCVVELAERRNPGR